MKALIHRAFVATVLMAMAPVVACGAPPAVAPAGAPTSSAELPSATAVPPTPTPAPATSAPPGYYGPFEGASRVRVGNQAPLNAAAVPFAKYLNAMHNRLHGYFSDDALGKLDALPPSDPLNDKTLATRVELELESQTGAIRRLVVVRSSGNASYDAIAVDAVRRAGPFGEADPLIRSSDDSVYVHWELARDPVFGCSTMHVRPFLLMYLTPRTPSP